MKKKGFTMIEMVIIVAIVGILAAFGTLRISGRAEKNAMITFKAKVPEFIRVTAQRAFEEGENYIIDIDGDGKVMRRKNWSTDIKEELFLPEILKYQIYGTTGDSIIIEVNDIGEGYLDLYDETTAVDEDIFVFNSKDKALYKMKIFSKESSSDKPIMYLRVETFLPEGTEVASYPYNDNWVKE